MDLVENLPEEVGPAVHLLFTANSAQLIVSLCSGGIHVLGLQGDAVAFSQKLESTTGVFATLVRILEN